MYAGGEDPAIYMQTAFGNVTDNEIEMHTVVGVVIANKDRLRQGELKAMSWPEWISEHFVLQDASGEVLELQRTNNSKLIKQHEVVGTQEFFLVTKLEIGQDYTFDYIPEIGAAKCYRREFTAPSSPEKVRQYLFSMVDR